MDRLQAKGHVGQAAIIAADGTSSLVSSQDILAEARSTRTAEDCFDSWGSVIGETNGLPNRLMEGRGPEGL